MSCHVMSCHVVCAYSYTVWHSSSIPTQSSTAMEIYIGLQYGFGRLNNLQSTTKRPWSPCTPGESLFPVPGSLLLCSCSASAICTVLQLLTAKVQFHM